jgi:hypothetical protein
MVSGIDQFIILLLGAFSLIVVITLAFQPWVYQERTPILALFVAVAALLWSGANTFFTVFWHPEDLRVYLRFPKPLQVGTNTLEVNYFFTNMGNQAALIEDVAMDELWINSTPPKIGAEFYRCDDVGYLGNTRLTYADSLPEPLRKPSQLKDGVLFAPAKPAKIYVDGAETKSASTIVEAGKMKMISTTFETHVVPQGEYNSIVICPVIKFFDSKGQPVLAVCRGWQQSSESGGGIVFGPPAGGSPAKLLPVASAGSCHTVRMSLDAS